MTGGDESRRGVDGQGYSVETLVIESDFFVVSKLGGEDELCKIMFYNQEIVKPLRRYTFECTDVCMKP